MEELKEKTKQELEIMIRDLRKEIENDRIKGHLGSKTSALEVKSKRKKLARALTLITELENKETHK